MKLAVLLALTFFLLGCSPHFNGTYVTETAEHRKPESLSEALEQECFALFASKREDLFTTRHIQLGTFCKE